MNNYPDDTFLARWLSGELSEQEREMFEASEDHVELQRLLKGLELLAPQPFEGERMLGKIKASIEGRKQTPIRRFGGWVYAVAAAVAVLIAVYVFFPRKTAFPQMISQEVEIGGQPTKRNFPDGSTFALNMASKIEYDEASWGVERAVKLEGEAYFEVKKGNDFVVKSDLGQVKVLGTKFNVIARDNFFQVECYEGRVEVIPMAGKVEILEAGQLYRPIPQQQIPIDSVLRSIPESSSGEEWLAGTTMLYDLTVSQIAKEFEHHYDIKVVLDEFLENDPSLQSRPIPHGKLELAIQTAFEGISIQGVPISIDTTELGNKILKLSWKK